MDIDKELEALLDDPLLNVSKEEESLFDMLPNINCARTLMTISLCLQRFIVN